MTADVVIERQMFSLERQMLSLRGARSATKQSPPWARDSTPHVQAPIAKGNGTVWRNEPEISNSFNGRRNHESRGAAFATLVQDLDIPFLFCLSGRSRRKRI
jgi:hypothetical protein